MEFRIRHMAIFLYAALGALGLVLKPELISNMNDLMLLIAPFIAMFTWDKLRSGSISAGPTV